MRLSSTADPRRLEQAQRVVLAESLIDAHFVNSAPVVDDRCLLDLAANVLAPIRAHAIKRLPWDGVQNSQIGRPLPA
jgi:hypothetical protein